MRILNSTLAVRLGRPDLSGVPRDPYGGSSGIPQVGAAGSIAGAIPGGNINAVLEGRLTAGVLLVILLGLGALYLWTRDLQA